MPASLELLAISSPLLGFLTDATVTGNGVEVDVSGWERGIVEFEVAVRIGHDVDAHSDAAAARAAAEAVGPAIEVANVDLPIGPEHVTEIVAGNIFHRAVILGSFDTGRAGLNTDGLTARIPTRRSRDCRHH